ncbi:MMS19 nucleotide excision repair protein [Entamoeba marina]
MDPIILKYLSNPTNEGKVLGLFILTTKYQHLLKKTSTELTSYTDEFLQYYKAIGPTFFSNAIANVDTSSPNASQSNTILTILHLFTTSSEVISNSNTFPIVLSILSRLTNSPPVSSSLELLLGVLGKMLFNPQVQRSTKIHQFLPLIFSLLPNSDILIIYANLLNVNEFNSYAHKLLSALKPNVSIQFIPLVPIENTTLNTKRMLIHFATKLLANKMDDRYMLPLLAFVARCISSQDDYFCIRPLKLINVIITRFIVECRTMLSMNTMPTDQIIDEISALIVYSNHLIRFNEGDETEMKKLEKFNIDFTEYGENCMNIMKGLCNLLSDMISFLEECMIDSIFIDKVVEEMQRRIFIVNIFQLSLTLAVLIYDIQNENHFKDILPILKKFVEQSEYEGDDFIDMYNAWKSFEDVND